MTKERGSKIPQRGTLKFLRGPFILPTRPLQLAAFLFAFASLCCAEGTHAWQQSSFDELMKGTANGVAIRNTGGLELSPAFKQLVTTPSSYIWAIGSGPSGDLFAAAGSPARVYHVTPDGKATPIFEPQELQVQTLVVDKNGVIYAATNPDGKVYRIEKRGPTEAKSDPSKATSSWSSSIYFEPHTKYIWDLAIDNSGNLYVATGDNGQIFKVTAKTTSSLFFTSDEAHIRVLAIDLQGNVIAGSDGSGLIYRIASNGDAFVLYSAPKKEITALTIDQLGNIYAAGVGEKRGGASGSSLPTTPIIMVTPGPSPAGPQGPGATSSAPASQAIPLNRTPGATAAATGGSEIYRIATDGSPTRVWTSRDSLVYALAFDSQGQLLAGTGNQGHIFAIAGEDRYTEMLDASATQVTCFAKAANGGLYASTSNLGKIFLLGGAAASEGSYESDVFDAQIFSRWGRMEYRGAGHIDLFARSGNVDNPDRHWSSWIKLDLLKDAAISVPPARFLQWKAVLHGEAAAPRLESVTVNYLPKNVAPDFDDVSIQAGTRYQPMSRPIGVDITLSSPGNGPPQPKFDLPPPSIHDADSIGVKWAVHDDNDDQMTYSLYYRGEGEDRWLLLKDNLNDKYYSFDSSLLPDGGYTIKVVATDQPSHPPGEALTSERESPRFEIDTTAPQITGLVATPDAGKIHISFHAADSFSPIKRAEYSIDAADWQFMDPVGQLSDSKSESYDFRAPLPATEEGKNQQEHVVVVRVYDRYDNMVAAKTVIRGK
jgi:WD40 repeat protein